MMTLEVIRVDSSSVIDQFRNLRHKAMVVIRYGPVSSD